MASPSPEDLKQHRRGLAEQYIQRSRGVLHLGAHVGQEAGRYAEMNKAVVWVEALPATHARLQQRLAPFKDQRAFCALLSDRDGVEQTFHVSNNGEGVSSSMFDFGDFGKGARSLWPSLNLHMVEQVTLKTTRLDTLFEKHGLDPAAFDYWIVDLQGAELLALQGAPTALQSCRALMVEVSTVAVYDGGVLWPQLRDWLTQAGFTPLWEPRKRHEDVLFVRQ